MSNSNLEQQTAGPDITPDRLSALFQTMVMQQANMALMFLGHVPHPESGETTVDLNGARFFIDQLEMLEVKTKGNLNRNEETLLKQNLMSLRMAFVEAADKPQSKPKEPAAASSAATAAPSSSPLSSDTSSAPGEAATDPAESESRKKFSKKY